MQCRVPACRLSTNCLCPFGRAGRTVLHITKGGKQCAMVKEVDCALVTHTRVLSLPDTVCSSNTGSWALPLPIQVARLRASDRYCLYSGIIACMIAYSFLSLIKVQTERLSRLFNPVSRVASISNSLILKTSMLPSNWTVCNAMLTRAIHSLCVSPVSLHN